MIKGWRNNPEWVVYYEKKQEAKIQRQIDTLRTQFQIEKLLTESKERISSIDGIKRLNRT